MKKVEMLCHEFLGKPEEFKMGITMRSAGKEGN